MPFHWAAPGYLMLFPLLGDLFVRLEPGRRRLVSAGAAATGLLVVSTAAMLAMQEKWNWLPLGFPDPLADAVDWTSLREGVPAGDADVGDRPVVAAIRWPVAGKLGYALGDAATVICLGPDPREYGIVQSLARFRGRDMVIVAPGSSLEGMQAGYGTMFVQISATAPLVVMHAGRPALSIPTYLGRGFHGPQGERIGMASSAGRRLRIAAAIR